MIITKLCTHIGILKLLWESNRSRMTFFQNYSLKSKGSYFFHLIFTKLGTFRGAVVKILAFSEGEQRNLLQNNFNYIEHYWRKALNLFYEFAYIFLRTTIRTSAQHAIKYNTQYISLANHFITISLLLTTKWSLLVSLNQTDKPSICPEKL